MNRIGWVVILGLIFISQLLRAEEGMWIPMLVEKCQMEEMEEAGLRLDAEDIYSINRECLKDAIVIFGGGCTGEIISKEGLLLTNHHCGESEIQYHSSLEQDYLSHGFWAKNREDELPNPGLSVTFLRYMKDVTDQVREGLGLGMDIREQKRQMEINKGKLLREATTGTNYKAEIVPFYYGNEFYLFVYERFRDVRLVGAPPLAIGDFGRDEDNWVWPRHTGDFSLFRVYADKENKPADYNPSNKPYKARKHLEIQTGGVNEGDFTMILGYPGRTTQYLHSAAVRSLMETRLPLKIKLRSTRLEIMDRHMKQSDEVRIQYAHKYRNVSNSWKKWQGEILGLERNKAIQKKRDSELEFRQWVDEDGERQMKYDQVMEGFESLYKEMDIYTVAVDLMNEAILAVEVFRLTDLFMSMMRMGLPVADMEIRSEKYFKDFHLPLDRAIFAAMMEAFDARFPDAFQHELFSKVWGRYNGDFNRFADEVYNKTIFSDSARMSELLETYKKNSEKAIRTLHDDPMVQLLDQIRDLYRLKVNPEYHSLEREAEKLYNRYMAGLLEMSGDHSLYPDANGTMRVTYGEVKGYTPRDGIEYHYASTLAGVIEKGASGQVDYQLPEKLLELYDQKDYGRYGENGTMPVCFIATNHTTGGNSGSPVLDGEGRLIGLNFDRQWEGTMSDVLYDPGLCRNIAVDIRYVLFIIDKFAGAGYLLEEMDIIW